VPSTDRLFELDDDSTVTVGAMKQLLQPLQMQVLELTQRMEAKATAVQNVLHHGRDHVGVSSLA
jgi:hypothetical protein